MLSKDQKEKALSENLYQRRGEGGSADVEEKEGTEEPQSVSPSISLLSSLHSSVRSIVGQIGNHLYQMPKWKYRLMVSSIVVLLISFLLLLFVSVVYGFGMSLPHIEVVAVDVVLPLPPDGSLPVRSLMRVNNPNRFSILVHPTDISVYSHPTRSPGSLLGVSTIPEHLLHAREGAHTTESVFVVRDLGSIEVCQVRPFSFQNFLMRVSSFY
ncbi:hypothetical protein Naga_100103g11 [Nannochloropsis gaditana]|uniref:Uncharacterized protein n=1 Tax=Nannochloropsis gaditana TaxID=72520 RepID=W7U2J0_9STRA|nr:hypothetical protein Naga_100103g11 [Nannochloropsis gaditana]